MMGGRGEYRRAPFLSFACELGATEMTTVLPVAFHQAVRNKKLSGSKVPFFSLSMPLAFMWRTQKSFTVLKRLQEDIKAKGGPRAVHLAWLGLLGTSSIVGLNAWWTFKIIRGTLKALKKNRKKGPPVGRPAVHARVRSLARLRA